MPFSFSPVNGSTNFQAQLVVGYREEVLAMLRDQADVTQDARAIGLQASGTRKYLSELTAEGAIVAEGENKGRRYRLRA